MLDRHTKYLTKGITGKLIFYLDSKNYSLVIHLYGLRQSHVVDVLWRSWGYTHLDASKVSQHSFDMEYVNVRKSFNMDRLSFHLGRISHLHPVDHLQSSPYV